MPTSDAAVGRTGIARGDGIASGDLGQKLLRRAAIEVADDAVVVEDRHLVMGEYHAQEVAVRPLGPAARRRDASRRGRAVVTVGDVEGGQRLEFGGEVIDHGGIADYPQLVGDVVVGRHGDVRIALGGAPEGRSSSGECG
jgi:hypothetical protein